MTDVLATAAQTADHIEATFAIPAAVIAWVAYLCVRWAEIRRAR